jgi:cell division protein FtsA
MALPDLRPAQAPAPAARRAAVLDLGVAKTVCLLAERDPVLELHPERPLKVIGIGAQSAPAVASGKPADFDACARSIRVALDQAERMADADITEVVATYSGPGLAARVSRGVTRVSGGVVTGRDLRAAVDAAADASPSPGQQALHVGALRYTLDGEAVSEPLGKQGRKLAVEACVVTAPAGALEALCACVELAGATVTDILAGPYVSGLAALSPEERAVGALVLDLGAGATGLAMFGPEGLIHAETVPIGGVRLTRDLAHRLETSFAAAERAKVVFGAVGPGFDPQETVETPRLGPDGRLEAAVAFRGAIAEALEPRLKEALLAVRERLAAAGRWGVKGPKRAVLIGGGAALPGMRALAAEALGMPVRIGAPLELAGFDGGGAGPAYAAAAGALRWRFDHAEREIAGTGDIGGATLWQAAAAMRGAAARAWDWLKVNF